jgi:hypothetical protein
VNKSSWLLQVYEMSDPASRESAMSLLASAPGVTVDARSCDRGDFLIAECPDTANAMAMYELVILADPHAELIYSATSSGEAQAIRDRMGADGEAASTSEGGLLEA